MSSIEWSLDQDEIISGMATKMIEKFETYWSVIHEMIAVATILDLRYKLNLVEYYYFIIYGSTYGEEVDNVYKICYELFHEYEEKYKRRERSSSISRDYSVSSQSCGSSVSSVTLGSRVSLKLHYNQWLANQYMVSVPQKTELNCYLEEPVMPQMDDFDVLSWWKTNTKYPILQQMPMDILAILISTVASELAFSTSGRFLSSHSNRLHPKTLEPLICCRDWLWATIRNEGLPCKMRYMDSDINECTSHKIWRSKMERQIGDMEFLELNTNNFFLTLFLTNQSYIIIL